MSWLSQFLRSIGMGGGRARAPSPAPTVPTMPGPVDDQISELVRLVNLHRQRYGLRPCGVTGELSSSASSWADMMNRGVGLRHRNPLPSDVFGEIIAWGYETPNAVFNGWKNSPGHNAIMLGDGFTRCGFGRAGDYWCGVFS